MPLPTIVHTPALEHTRQTKRLSVIGGVLLCGLALGACNRGPSIRAIVQNPERYLDSLVTMNGTAVEPQGFSFGQSGVGWFTLIDGKDSIKVVASSALPADQQRVRVTGHVRGGMALGVVRYGPVVEESRREGR